MENAATSRPLTSPFLSYSDETVSELAVLRAAASAHATFGMLVIPQCIISMTRGVSDLLEVALLLKEVGLVEYRFQPDSFEVRHVRAPGQTDVWLDELIGRQ